MGANALQWALGGFVLSCGLTPLPVLSTLDDVNNSHETFSSEGSWESLVSKLPHHNLDCRFARTPFLFLQKPRLHTRKDLRLTRNQVSEPLTTAVPHNF